MDVKTRELFSLCTKGDHRAFKSKINDIKKDQLTQTLKTTHNKCTLLHTACRHGYSNIVECLIEKGADIEDPDSLGKRALHLAAEAGKTKVVDYLIKKKVDVLAYDSEKNQALHLACINGYIDTMRSLLSSHANVRNEGRGGYLPVHIASEKNNVEMLKVLKQQHKADLRAKVPSQKDIQPIHVAVLHAQTDVTDYLLENGANITDTDSSGYQPIHHAAMSQHDNAVQMIQHLKAKNADMKASSLNDGPPLELAAAHGQVDIMKYLLSVTGFNIDHPGREGRRLIHHASKSGHIVMLKYLIDQGKMSLKSARLELHRTIKY